MKEIPLTQGKVALVDDADFERVSAFKWHAHLDGRGATWYAVRNTRVTEKDRWLSCKVRMSYFVLNLTPHELPLDHIVEHADQNSLNNQRSNLRIVHKNVNMLLSPGWKNKGTVASVCAQCDVPVMPTEFLCEICLTPSWDTIWNLA